MASPRYLTAFDDYFVHQVDEPLVAVDADDARWLDRGNFWVHDREGTITLVVGMGSYANSKVMDGFACAVVGNTQHNLRLSRRMRGDRTNMRVGPLSYQVTSPLAGWQFKLLPNEMNISFELTFEGRAAPFLMKKHHIAAGDVGKRPFGQSHFTQLGTYSGWIEVAGERREGSFLGVRDRSWGVRATRPGTAIHLWLQLHFPRFSVALMHQETRDGAIAYSDGAVLYDSGESVPIAQVHHRLRFGGATIEHDDAMVRLTLANGKELHLRAERRLRGVFLAGAGYGGWHGVPRGDSHWEGERWDLSAGNNPPASSLPIKGYDQVARFLANDEEGIGVFETALSGNPAYRYQPTW